MWAHGPTCSCRQICRSVFGVRRTSPAVAFQIEVCRRDRYYCKTQPKRSVRRCCVMLLKRQNKLLYGNGSDSPHRHGMTLLLRAMWCVRWARCENWTCILSSAGLRRVLCYWCCSIRPIQEIGQRPWTTKKVFSVFWFWVFFCFGTILENH